MEAGVNNLTGGQIFSGGQGNSSYAADNPTFCI
jgi:hypothetical protein